MLWRRLHTLAARQARPLLLEAQMTKETKQAIYGTAGFLVIIVAIAALAYGLGWFDPMSAK